MIGPPAFASVNACIDNFERDCSQGSATLCAANRTCEPQFPALDCCLTSGQLVSVHLIVNPTAPRCLLRDLIPNAVLTLSQGWLLAKGNLARGGPPAALAPHRRRTMRMSRTTIAGTMP